MAWFPCNIGGGSSEIANILKGTSNPISSIGDNGQLYLKYGSDTRYTYDETLGGYVLNDYFYSEANQSIGTVGGRVYSKNSNGAAIAVMWKNLSYSGPLLISTVESNITYSYNTSGSLGFATIDGVTWYLSTTNYWSNPVQSSVAPIIEADYYPTASSHLQDAIEDILEASDFKTSLSTTVVIDSFAKVNNAWQNLIGTDVNDIDYTGEGRGEIKTLVYTLGAGGQWETFSNPSPGNGMLLYEVKDSNGDIVLSVKKKISDLPIYNAYVALGIFDTNKTINAARSSDNSTIYLSVNNVFTGYSLKVYTFEPAEPSIEDYITDYFPCLLDSNYYVIFSKASNDEIYSSSRGGTRASSNPVFYFCCKTTTGYWGYGVIGLTSPSVQITATTSYGSAEYYTQTTTNGNTVYLARLGAMIGGQSSNVFKNGYFEIDIDGSQYVEQDGSTWLFDQTFVDAAYEALTALS